MKNLLYIGNKLSNKGKTVTSIETLGKFLDAEGFKVITASNKSNKFLRLLDMLCHVIKYRKVADYVLIDTYSTSNFYYAYFVSQLCRLFRIKYIPILRGGKLPIRLKKSPKLSKAIFNNAYVNIAPSLYIKSNFEDLGYHNIICIPNSIELKKYTFKENTFDTIKLLWVRSFSKIYNPQLAIKVLKTLKDNGLNASLCMVGPENDGSLQDTKTLANTLGVEVVFTGKLSKQEWLILSSDYNIFINTANFDNMPVSVIEAMALGLPVISTNVGGIPFLIKHQKNGILVNPNNVNEFVEQIVNLIDSPSDANRLAKSARTLVEDFDWLNIKNQWVELLR
ncbi:glycosyltransferase family 4 protein [uncultured Algibacter sp.]|uniref:glycosyltransferase family 4 protein n=1 Tax=uncultured Algibacter sp. TaxID=298659 RepID=UPI00321734ED